jgi:hypothetical protein
VRWFECDIPKQRIRKGFLFFPLKIGNEIRWLEKVSFLEKSETYEGITYWIPIKFLD